MVWVLVCTITVCGADHAQQSPPGAAAQRVAERLRALQQEASALQSREKTLLNELRKLELERQIKAEELSVIEQDLSATRERLGAATARAAALRESADAQRPEIEKRLVRLYKMGRAGYWRLLLDVEDVQSMGRAYRTASALTRIDRDRVKQHEQTLAALDRERRDLEARAKEFTALQRKASASRAAMDRAVASRAALVTSIEQRRDLTVQLASELEAAQQRLQAAAAQPGEIAGPVLVPIRPFRGQMPWPADGIVVGRFGRQPVGRVPGINVTRNGIDLSLPDGRTVAAIHEGVVTFAGPFTAYGNLVIVDHGGGAQTLYGHLASVSVNRGDRVSAGTQVGLSGRNPGGNPALYFELRIDGRPVDPLQWLRRQP
ncbi:MAG: peptidoglycan DD-metalloendopeptidase family protein [Vicinamibacterales bacterium]